MMADNTFQGSMPPRLFEIHFAGPDPNTFIHVKCLILESYLGPRQHLSWNSLWRKLTTESH